MIIKALQFLMVFTLGLIIGIWPFGHSTTNLNANSENSLTSTEASLAANDWIEPELTSNLSHLELQLKEQADTIASLKNQVNQLQTVNKQLSQNKRPNNDSQSITEAAPRPELEVLTMQDFETRIKDQFLDRFRGIAIQLEGEQLAEVKTSFSQNQNKDGWSAQYENYISDYFSQNNPSNAHFIEEINCNTRMCRLKVQPGDTNQWKKLYANLTQQEWYSSMTLVEQSESSNTKIYYIPKPFNP
ncbi:hypothetical protein [Aliikangiella sp. IMCC44632]